MICIIIIYYTLYYDSLEIFNEKRNGTIKINKRKLGDKERVKLASLLVPIYK